MNLEHADERAGPTVLHIITSAQTLLFLSDHIAAMEQQGVAYHVIANFDQTTYAADEKRRHHVELSRSLFSLGDIRGLFAIRRKLKAIAPDTIIVSTPKAALVGSVAARLFARKAQLIFLVRGFRFPTMAGLKGQLVKFLEVFPARLADRTLGTSPQTADTIRDLLPARLGPRMGVTLNGTANGIDMDVFSPENPNLAPVADVRARYGVAEDDFLILIVARVCNDKGFKELTKAFDMVRTKHPHAKLLVVGENDPPDALPPAAQARLDEISIRVGQIDNKALPEVFRAADILAYPSHREGFGISAIEAAAMGTPTIASRVGGLQTAVQDGVSGVFHPVGDAQAIAERIMHFIENPDDLARMSASAMEYAQDRYDRRLYDAFWLELFTTSGDTDRARGAA